MIGLLNQLLRRRREQDGAVIVIVAVLLTLFLAVGALAIDLSSARGSQQKAQTAADAAALAVSDAASSGTTSTAQLQTIAQNIADANYPGQTVTVVSSGAGTYRVSVSGNSSGPFATGIGSHDPRVSASSLAGVNSTTTSGVSTSLSSTTVTSTATHTSTSYAYSYSNTYTPCSAFANANCLAVYAAGTNCSGTGFNGVAGSDEVNGAVLSASSFQAGGGSNYFTGPLWYSDASGCTWGSAGGSNTYNGGTPQPRTPVSGWPIDYSVDFPSCSGSGCTGPSGTPSFCSQFSTATTWNLSVSAKSIYCAVGSGTKSQPSTWNGKIVIQNGNSSDTFVGGSVSMQGGGINITAPCGGTSGLSAWSSSNCASNIPAPATRSYPMFYMTATGTAIDLGGGSATFYGDSFAPNGNVTVSAGSVVCDFIEAQYVTVAAGSDVVDGTGPSVAAAQATSTSTSLSSSSSTSTSISTSTSTTTTTSTGTKTGSSSLLG